MAQAKRSRDGRGPHGSESLEALRPGKVIQERGVAQAQRISTDDDDNLDTIEPRRSNHGRGTQRLHNIYTEDDDDDDGGDDFEDQDGIENIHRDQTSRKRATPWRRTRATRSPSYATLTGAVFGVTIFAFAAYVVSGQALETSSQSNLEAGSKADGVVLSGYAVSEHPTPPPPEHPHAVPPRPLSPPPLIMRSPPLSPPLPTSPSPSSPPMLSPPPEATWEVYEGKNCFWDGHGADEVDTPRGSSVPGVSSVDACKAACLEAARDINVVCDGVLFQPGTGKCYRKANIDPSSCSYDRGFVLYVRTDPNRPPAAPRQVDVSGQLTSAKCTAMMRNPDHKFYRIWSPNGWSVRQPGTAACWDVDWTNDWFDWIANVPNCDQSWGKDANAATVFGFAESMEDYCRQRAGRRRALEPGWVCDQAGLNILRIGTWNMCRNAEWMMCVVQGNVGLGGEIIFTLAPRSLDIDYFKARPYNIVENDIYYLEVFAPALDCLVDHGCPTQIASLQRAFFAERPHVAHRFAY